MQATQILLARGSIQEMESRQIRAQFNEEAKRKLNSRKSIQTGGALTAADALEKIRIKRQKEGEEGVRKATKAIRDFEKRAKEANHRAGVQARRDESRRKKLLKELYKAGEIPDPLLLVPIRDPEKEPTIAEQEALQVPPGLSQALQITQEQLENPFSQATLIQGIPIDPQLLLANDPLHTKKQQFVISIQADEEEKDATDQERRGGRRRRRRK
jgi:hypothetical protein